jgi:uncharacterized protein
MRFLTGILAAVILTGGSALAQTPATGTPKTPAPAHQPGAPAQPPAASAAPSAQEAPPALEKADPAKEAAIRHLMDLTQTSKLGDSIANYISGQVRSVMGRTLQKPDDLQKFMDAFTQKFTAAAPSSAVTDAQIPVYSHFFSMEDIEALIKFYESPLGQRVVKTLPQVAQQTQQAGMQIDQKAAIEVLRSMSIEYPELKQMLPPEPGAAPAPAPAPAPGPGAGAAPSGPPPPPAEK